MRAPLSPRELRAYAYTKKLKRMPKAEVFAIYERKCLGRVHCAKASEIDKGHMILDIVAAEYGEETASKVY